MEQTIRNLSHEHKSFIRELFKDKAVAKYIIVEDEFKEDAGDLVDFWLGEAKKNAGVTFIVCAIEPATFFRPEREVPCGFISFERRTQHSGRITYALKEAFRGHGYIKTGLKYILNLLKSNWQIQTVEADIDKENIASEKIVKILGFSVNKQITVVDLERGGKLRHIWSKQI